VTLNLRKDQSVLGWADVPNPVAGQAAMFSLGLGQVLQIFTPGASTEDTLSGAEIVASAPLQALSGAGCASIPLDPTRCGHVEDVVLPTETLGKEYVVPVLRSASGARLPHTIRVQSISEETPVTFEPTMLTGVTLGRGEVVEIANATADLHISSTVPFAVNQYVQARSNAVPDALNVGGPSQVSLPAISQFKMAYIFAASPSFEANFASIVAPTGASVTLDGQMISAALFVAVGASGMSVAQVALAQNDRVHLLSSDKNVGLVVYGYAPYASYAYTGGLDLSRPPMAPAP
jgi:IgGFc binding protein